MQEALPSLGNVVDLEPIREGMFRGQFSRSDEVCEQEPGNAFYDSVYLELREMAARKLSQERLGHLLEPSELVHDAWLRFGKIPVTDRECFFASASEAMRRILIESARRRARHKRGGDLERVEYLEERTAGSCPSSTLLLINDALETLDGENHLMAQVVELRFFFGFTHPEISQVLELNERAVRRLWKEARLRLRELIDGDVSTSAPAMPYYDGISLCTRRDA